MVCGLSKKLRTVWRNLGLVAALTDGLVHDCARATFYAGLAAWAWKEVDDGVNWARRAIGAAGLVFVIVKIAEALRA